MGLIHSSLEQHANQSEARLKELASEKQILKDSHQKETERGVQLKALHEETTKRNEELKAKIEEIRSSKHADSLGNLSGYHDALADEVKSQQTELLGLRG
jgi:predicted Holliday junction resolvase-like endonuclease